MKNELPEANWKEKVLFYLGMRRGIRVEGDSMLPNLKDGDGILIDSDAKISIGDIILAKHPFKKSVIILKRLTEIDQNGHYFLVGDNPSESSDSRTFGALSAKHILGKAVCRLK
jgi:nickel-type superoxide dismutase maturation protease